MKTDVPGRIPGEVQYQRDSNLLKISTFVAMLLCMVSQPVTGAEREELPVDKSAIVSRGPNHRVWSRTNVSVGLDGLSRSNVSSFVELGSGMHRWSTESNRWIDAEAVLEIEGNTAVGRKGAHQVTFAANANTAGSVNYVTPDGKRLRSHVLGIALFDSANNHSEMIATIKDSQGELYPPNVVVYSDAFDGLKADLRYTYRLGSFEQDVIVKERLDIPEGFAPDTTRLEVWTEFLESPAALVTQGAVSGMTDDTLDFGAIQTGPGRAFSLQGESPNWSVPVSKQWFTIDGRTCLVEAVRLNAVSDALNRLPAAQASIKAGATNRQVATAPGKSDRSERTGRFAAHFGDRQFPPAPQGLKSPNDRFRTRAVQTAGLNGKSSAVRSGGEVAQGWDSGQNKNGLVLDYTLYSSFTNLVLQGDTTYYLSNTVNTYGTLTCEGGTVVKFARTNTAQININGTVTWLTGQYRKAVFTAVDDNSIGEKMATSTLSGYYGGTYLCFTGGASSTNENLRIAYAKTAIQCNCYYLTLRHAQFLNCSNVIDSSSFGSTIETTLENVLLHNVQHVDVISGGATHFTGTHLTVDICDTFVVGSGTWTPTLQNCIFFDVYNWGAELPDLDSCYIVEDATLFQTVGAGAHYLIADSPLRNAGVTLSGQLASDIKKRTTWPPIVITASTYYTNSMVLSPQAFRDIDTPDLGYHYDPLDYVMGGVPLTNATVTVLPGTAVGTYNPGSGYGLALMGNSAFYCEGTPTNLNRIVSYNTVQEQSVSSWTNTGPAIVTTWMGSANPLTLQARFTEWSRPAYANEHLTCYLAADGGVFLRDCQIFGSSISSPRLTLNMSNCMLHRVSTYLGDNEGDFIPGHSFRNCLFYGGDLTHEHFSADTWNFRDNCFVDFTVNDWSGVALDADYNAYTTNLTRLLSSATHDVLLATNNLGLVAGPLGNFYLPTNGPATNLFNKGSTTANLLGLWHFTSTTNQVKETNSVVDIGFHLVAVGSNNLPLDTDGDLWPDYWEDGNGNGTLDSSETKPNDSADRGLRVFIAKPSKASNIP